MIRAPSAFRRSASVAADATSASTAVMRNLARLARPRAGDAAEDAADGHADPREVALPENISGHHLAGAEEIRNGAPFGIEDVRRCIHFQAKVRERDAGPQRIADEGRRVDALRPMRLRWLEPLGPAIVEARVVERAWANRRIEFLHGASKRGCVETELRRELLDGLRFLAREDRRHESPAAFASTIE
jgi:hypothetical protein